LDPTPLRRALDAAPDKPTESETIPDSELFCIRVGNLPLAFPAVNVREVVRPTPLTPLPRTPAFLMGVCGHRGEVLPVVDLLRFLARGEMQVGTRSRLVIGVSGAFVVALLADTVVGLRRVQAQKLLPAPLGGDAANEYLDGVVQLPDGPLHVVNMGRLLQGIRQRVVYR
jgi:purine-binding chemotaxis protein CheW